MNTPNQPTASSAAEFIANCELAECEPSAKSSTAASGAVVASSLLAFAEGTSAQGRQDVTDSFLFATRAANKAYDPESQADQWYKKFNDVLTQLGWFSDHWNFAGHNAGGRRFSMGQVGLDVLASALVTAALPGPASAAMLKITGDALKALRTKEQPLRLFESQSRTHRGASFRIAGCVEVAGLINVVMGAVNFQSSSRTTDVLFWEWSSSDVQTWRGEGRLILNGRLYAENRDLVQARLGASSRQAIAEIEI